MSSRQIRSGFLDAFHTRDKLGLMKNFIIVNNFCFSWKSVGVQLGTLTENVHPILVTAINVSNFTLV